MAAINPDELDRKIAQARSLLKKIPGVLGVGYAYKSRAGNLTQELSLVTFVREKKPLAELSPAEVIPREVLGIPTDVVRAPRIRNLNCMVHDKFEIMVGGIAISTLRNYVATSSLVGDSLGTLGFFGTLNNSSSQDRIVGLTNHHVIEAPTAAAGNTIYQPKITGNPGSYTLAREDMHPIGSIENLGKRGNHPYAYAGDPAVSPAPEYFVDCASIKINTKFSSCCGTNKGIKFGNLVHDLNKTALGSGGIEGIARVRNVDVAAVSEYKVYKVGETTGWTTGKLFAAEMDLDDPIDPTIHYGTFMMINDLGPNCGGGSVFARGGDSGAVVVNSDRKIVGLLVGDLEGLPGYYYACHIHPVSDYLGITMVSTQNTAGASGGATALKAALALDESSSDVARAMALREEILHSERGRLYQALIDQHTEEVVHLVNRVRPVTVTWHRLHGPDFLGHVLHASRHADHSVPRELHGLSRDQALARMLETLSHHGSAALRADIERYSAQVRELFRQIDEIEDLAERLRVPESMECVNK